MATVHIPSLLRHLTDGLLELPVEVVPGERPTVRTLLERLDASHPGLLAGMLMDDDLMPGLAVFVDDEQALMALGARVEPDSVVHIIPPVVGG